MRETEENNVNDCSKPSKVIIIISDVEIKQELVKDENDTNSNDYHNESVSAIVTTYTKVSSLQRMEGRELVLGT